MAETPENGAGHRGGGTASGSGGGRGRSVSFFKTCLNVLNALTGTGILSIPYALASGGWLSLTLLMILAVATFYSGILIKRLMDIDPSIKTYPEIGDRAFGKKGRIIVSIIMYIELYLVATGFLILEGDNLPKVLPSFGSQLTKWLHVEGKLEGKQIFVVIVALIILPTVWFNDMNLLSYVSGSGILVSVIILGSVAWIGLFDGVGFKHKGALINWTGMPLAVSLYAFCYTAHPVFPAIYNSMRNKRQFSNVLLICYVFCTLSYMLTAILGYLMFGSHVQSQITLNLPSHRLSSKIAVFMTLATPITKYALVVLPIINAMKIHFPACCSKRVFGVLIGTGLVISTVIFALAVPFFGYLMALVGAFLDVATAILFPSLCYLKITGKYHRFNLETFALMMMVLMGIIVMVVGTYTSVREIVVHL